MTAEIVAEKPSPGSAVSQELANLWAPAPTCALDDNVMAVADHPYTLLLPHDVCNRAFLGGSLVMTAFVGSFSRHTTCAPLSIDDSTWAPLTFGFIPLLRLPTGWPEAEAGHPLLQQLKALSGLTYDELAPLAGVSRRRLHAWNKGETISAKRERRLRGLLEAVKAMAAVRAGPLRAALLDRGPGGMRPYDLLADGLDQQALDAVAGRRTVSPSTPGRSNDSLAAQLDRAEDSPALKPGRLRTDLSGRIR